MKISATIITLNEERNIERAIKSLSFVDEIIVLDSNSNDNTVAIAKSLGAHVIDQPFFGYGQQKNIAASKATHDWILSIDADEEITPELKESILSVKNGNTTLNAYAVNRRTNFCGKWILHGGWYPDHLIRLYNKKIYSWTTPTLHEEIIVPVSDQGLLKGHLNHFSFASYNSQLKINYRYAYQGAQELLQKNRVVNLTMILLKPIGKFIETFILKMGFLDGRSGLIIAINASYSIYMKYLLAIDLKKGRIK